MKILISNSHCGLAEFYDAVAKEMGLKPVMTLKSVINTIKIYETNTPVSYGGIYTTDKKERLGVLPIGYADGFMRILSDKYNVKIGDVSAPVRGKICMDMCII